MATMGFALLCFHICLLSALSSEGNGAPINATGHDSKHKSSNKHGLGPNAPKRTAEKDRNYTSFDYDRLGPNGWRDFLGGPIPSSLPAGVQFGPYIPLGIPVPLPSSPSLHAGGDLDGMPIPAPSAPSYPGNDVEGMPILDPFYATGEGSHLDGVPFQVPFYPYDAGYYPEEFIVNPGTTEESSENSKSEE